ncbi:hypothetical protein AB3X96_39885 [Paraburkholderia sp. BR13439]
MPRRLTETIHFEMRAGGFAHLVWGSKPTQYLETGDVGGIYPTKD